MPEPITPVEVKIGFRKKITPEMRSVETLDFAKLDPNSLRYLLKRNKKLEKINYKVAKERVRFDEYEERRRKRFLQREAGGMPAIRLRDLWYSWRDRAPSHQVMKNMLQVAKNSSEFKNKSDEEILKAISIGKLPPEVKYARKALGNNIGYLGSIPQGLYNITEVRQILDDYYPAKRIADVIKQRDAEAKLKNSIRVEELNKELKKLIKPQTSDRMNATIAKLRPVIDNLAVKAGNWQKGIPTQAPAVPSPVAP